MKRLLKLLAAAIVAAAWYEAKGRDLVFGPPVDDDEPEPLAVIRSEVTLPPPSINHVWTREAADRAPGTEFGKEGIPIGVVTRAALGENGTLVVGYEADRARLGHPITVAVAQADHFVRQAVADFAVRL